MGRFGLSTLLFTSAVVSAVEVSIPTRAPSGAPIVSPALVSFSIEQDRWTDWAGISSTNEFTYNAFNNLKGISGQPPWIRIGADSEDHTLFDASVEYSTAIFPPYTAVTPYPEASNITVGYKYYQLASHLPPGTHVIWGVDLGRYNLTAAYLEAEALLEAFTAPSIIDAGITLDFIEVGNEADLYSSNGARNSSWDITEYVSQWTQFATNISNALNLYAPTAPKFMGVAFADSSHNTTGFSPQSAFANGLLNSPAGSLIKLVSQHHYSGSFCAGSGGLLQDLMSKATIRSNLSSFDPDIAAVHAEGLPYVLGETNSYACHGAPGVSNTAGQAIWALDYSLYASQIGIERLHFHEGIGYKYNFIQPLALNRSILDGSPVNPPLAPHIQPAYYTAIISSEAIGASSDTQVAELTVDDTWISGYAFYEAGVLQRAVLINSQAYLPGDASRTSTDVTFEFTGPSAPTEVTVKRLAIQYANDTSGVMWGGQTYETPDALVSGALSVQTGPVSSGVTITETEIVLLSFSG